MRRLWFVIACLLPLTAAGQTPRRVFVDAATDAGTVAGDLKPEEFTVTEGGERREISSITQARRPMRLILLVDSTEGIRGPIGQIRQALTGFINAIDTQHEMMLMTLSGTMSIRAQPTLDRQPLLKEIDRMFGTVGSNPMHRMLDEVSKRFVQTTDHRAVIVAVTTEGFASAAVVNQKDLLRIGADITRRGGVLHTVRMLVPTVASVPAGEPLTDFPVSVMVSQATDGIVRETAPPGLAETLKTLAGSINDSYGRTPMSYQIEYATAPVKGKKPAVPQVSVTRPGIRVNVIY